MKKLKNTKLSLNSDTIRTLSSANLKEAQGGEAAFPSSECRTQVGCPVSWLIACA